MSYDPARRLVEDNISASEAVYGFCAWLTTQDKPVTMSSHHDCAIIAELIDKYCKTNNLSDPADDYNKRLVFPVENYLPWTTYPDNGNLL